MNTCKQCKKNYEISDIEIAKYKQFGFEPAGLCFDCDHKNRMCFRAEGNLYSRTCDETKEKIISIYSSDKPYKVYKSSVWHGNSWDALDYGMNFDFSRSFFEQFKDLQLKVPRPALSNVNGENSEYCNNTGDNKNCYLVFGGDYNEDVQYGVLCMYNKDSLDIDISDRNEQCYFLGDSNGCYGCEYIFDSKNCKNSYYLSDCIDATECILSTNLVNKSYYILNKPYSKEEYFKNKKELINGSYEQRQKNWIKFLELRGKRKVKSAHIVNCENCTGDYLRDCKNCYSCFDVAESEDMTNVIFSPKSNNCFNTTYMGHSSANCYSTMSAYALQNSAFCYFIAYSGGIYYSELIQNCHDCFGCIGLTHKKYCILNKQYSKEEYKTLKAKIVDHMKKTGEWGQFFPPELSCFGYNESTANKYYPLTKKEALAQGFKWSEVEEKSIADKYIPASRLPDDIADVPDDILNWAIECETSGRYFKVNKQELNFYRKQNLPIPHLHPNERHKIRWNLRNPHKLYDRKCQKCDADVVSSYSPDRPETVYCEPCYLFDIY